MRKHDMTLTEHDAVHERVWQNLPWLVNGTLGDVERTEADAHLATCLVCRRELAMQRQLQAAISERSLDPRCETALERLHERMLAPDPARPFPWAAAAVLMIVFGLTAFVGINQGLISGFDRIDEFRTLGSRTIAVSDNRAATARIIFARDMTELQMRRLLLEANAELVDGPTPRGAYTISMPGVIADADLDRVLTALRDSGRVLFVEPVVTEYASP